MGICAAGMPQHSNHLIEVHRVRCTYKHQENVGATGDDGRMSASTMTKMLNVADLPADVGVYGDGKDEVLFLPRRCIRDRMNQ